MGTNKRVKWIPCPKCKHEKFVKFERGDIWINDRNYKVQILDFGFDEVWLLYLDNGNRTAWKHEKFLEQYTFIEKGKKDANNKI